MGLYHLDKIFEPSSVAVVGASQREGSIGSAIMQNLIQGSFQGPLLPINPKHDTIHGIKAYPTLAEVKETIDLVIIATPIATVPDIVRECAEAHAGGVIIISAGGRETGRKGLEIEQRIGEEAHKGGLRVVGPNCLGIICPGRKLNASFAAHMPHLGKLAFISQSGAICTAILDLSLKEEIGFSHFVSIGSMLDVDFSDLIDYFGADPEVSSILLYIESLMVYRKFMSAARAVSRVKPIVVLKSGRSAAGARAAASHTGAMAGEDSIYDAAFKRAGIVRVDTIEELFDCAELVGKQPRPPGPRLAIVTNAGGPGVMAADAIARYGVDPAPLAPETQDKLNEVMPPFWSHANPIDILGDASPERYAAAVEICLKARELDGVMVILTPQAMTDPTAVAEALARNRKKVSYPMFASWMGGVDVQRGRDILNDAGIPTYDTPERAVRAFMYMCDYSRNLKLLQEIPPKLSHTLSFHHDRARELVDRGLERADGLLTELESKSLLDACGIPVNRMEVATSEEQAVETAPAIGYPLAMKIHSLDITHKTEAGGVQLDLMNADDVRAAYRGIMESARAYRPDAEILGVTLQPMIRRPDYEVLLGAKKDPNFGPVILFGMGGTFTEVLRDRAIGLPPLNRLLARMLMEETRVFKLLQGFRNRPPADLERLEEMIVRLSELMTDFAEIEELDINPVIITNGRPCAVDARVVVRAPRVAAPLHLVISPYPEQYESHETTAAGIPIFVRPIKPEDAPLMVDLFNTLSPTSVYYRFFSHLRALPHNMLARFTQIDYDREISLVAIDESSSDEKMLGTARVISDPDGREAEFAVLVGDPWQGKGVGAVLLDKCLRLAQQRCVESVWGIALDENIQMLALARKLGFSVRKIPRTDESELRIDLRKVCLEP